MEAMIFILRITCGVGFMAIAYLTKLQAFFKDAQKLENDDDPYNNKDTEDFMSHLKQEYYVITY